MLGLREENATGPNIDGIGNPCLSLATLRRGQQKVNRPPRLVNIGPVSFLHALRMMGWGESRLGSLSCP